MAEHLPGEKEKRTSIEQKLKMVNFKSAESIEGEGGDGADGSSRGKQSPEAVLPAHAAEEREAARELNELISASPANLFGEPKQSHVYGDFEEEYDDDEEEYDASGEDELLLMDGESKVLRVVERCLEGASALLKWLDVRARAVRGAKGCGRVSSRNSNDPPAG